MEVGEEEDYRPKYSWFLVDKQTDPASVQLSLLFVKSDSVTVWQLAQTFTISTCFGSLLVLVQHV